MKKEMSKLQSAKREHARLMKANVGFHRLMNIDIMANVWEQACSFFSTTVAH